MKTAVEWLYERLERMIPREALYNMDKKQYFEQAKAMEKEQIIEAYNQGEFNQGCNGDAEQYYNETYKNNL